MAYISRDNLETIIQSLQGNIPLRLQLPNDGRIHIDRQLPFLIVYRRPCAHTDLGTERLVLGEAAYIIADDTAEHTEELSHLISDILTVQKNVFGACLLLEIWSGPEITDESRQPGFHIYAPTHGASNSFLESMENALLGISINKQNPSVSISYRSQVTPTSFVTLLTDEQIRQLNCLTIGLEIAPIYRDFSTGTLLPFRLHKLHHKLARALKRSLYSFVHECTPLRPTHFHELGRRFMTDPVYEADSRLAAISSRFDLLLHVTPTNALSAWHEFEKHAYQKTPEFLYRPRPLDPGIVKRELFAIEIEQIEDPTLAYMFSKKRQELDRQLTLIADRNTPRFLLGSRQLFGDITTDLLALAQQILDIENKPGHVRDPDNYLGAADIARHARDELSYYRQLDPTFSAQAEVRDDITGVLVSKGNFLIGTDARVVPARLKATLAHEISTHALTYYNGSQQPFKELHAGMAGYESMQEGLAVLNEYLVGGLDFMRMRLLACRVLAVQMITDGASFIDTFRQLHQEYHVAPYTAFTIAMRVFRGGGYTKDMVYLLGLQNILDYIAEGGDLHRLYVGKIAYEYRHVIEELHLRRVITEASLLPRFLDDEDSKGRLQKLQQGITVLELVQEIQ